MNQQQIANILDNLTFSNVDPPQGPTDLDEDGVPKSLMSGKPMSEEPQNFPLAKFFRNVVIESEIQKGIKAIRKEVEAQENK